MHLAAAHASRPPQATATITRRETSQRLPIIDFGSVGAAVGLAWMKDLVRPNVGDRHGPGGRFPGGVAHPARTMESNNVRPHAKTLETGGSLDRLGYRWFCAFCAVAAEFDVSTIRPTLGIDPGISYCCGRAVVARSYAAALRGRYRVGNGYRPVRE